MNFTNLPFTQETFEHYYTQLGKLLYALYALGLILITFSTLTETPATLTQAGNNITDFLIYLIATLFITILP